MVQQRKPLAIPTGDADAGTQGEHLLSLGPGKLPVWSKEAHWDTQHKTAIYTLTRRESGSLRTNLGATGTVTLTLPSDAVKGDVFWIHVLAAYDLRVDPGDSGAFYINGAKQADSKYIVSASINDWVLAVADGSADWTVFKSGTWQVESASESTTTVEADMDERVVNYIQKLFEFNGLLVFTPEELEVSRWQT